MKFIGNRSSGVGKIKENNWTSMIGGWRSLKSVGNQPFESIEIVEVGNDLEPKQNLS